MTEDALTHALDIARIGRPYTHWPASGVISTPYDNPHDPAARFVDFGLARAVTEILNAVNDGRLVRSGAATTPRPVGGEAADLAEVERLVRKAVALGRSNPPGSDDTARHAEDVATRDALDAIRAHIATLTADRDRLAREVERLTGPVEVPAGYALVPIEPTPEMCVELFGSRQILRGRWLNMLAATAPPSDAADQGGDRG